MILIDEPTVLVARQNVARFRRILWVGAGLAAVAALGAFAVDELKTSRLQSALWRDLASDARFSVDAGASDAIRFPRTGPYDERLGRTLATGGT